MCRQWAFCCYCVFWKRMRMMSLRSEKCCYIKLMWLYVVDTEWCYINVITRENHNQSLPLRQFANIQQYCCITLLLLSSFLVTTLPLAGIHYISELWHIFDSWNCNKCDNCHRVWCHECVTNVRCHVTSSWHTWWHSFLSHSEMFTSWKSIINFYCQCLTPNRWKSVDCKNEMCWKRLWKLIRQNQQTRIQASLFSRRGHVWWKINTGGKYLIQQDTKIFKGGC